MSPQVRPSSNQCSYSRRLWRCCAAGDFGCQLRWNVDVEGRRPTNVGPSQKPIRNMDRSDDLKFQSDDFYLWMEKKIRSHLIRQAAKLKIHSTFLVEQFLFSQSRSCHWNSSKRMWGVGCWSLKSQIIWCHRYDMNTWWHVKNLKWLCIPYLVLNQKDAVFRTKLR